MFAVAFDLDTNQTETHHPRSVTQAYTDIRVLLGRFGFDWRQGSVYTCDNEDLANLFAAMNALKALPWFPLGARYPRLPRRTMVGLHRPDEVWIARK